MNRVVLIFFFLYVCSSLNSYPDFCFVVSLKSKGSNLTLYCTAPARKNSRFILSEKLDFHMIDNQLVAVQRFILYMLS